MQSQQVMRSDDGALARILSTRDYDGRTLAWDEGLEKAVSGLTPNDVATAMRHHLDPAQISIVKAGDFAKAAKPATSK